MSGGHDLRDIGVELFELFAQGCHVAVVGFEPVIIRSLVEFLDYKLWQKKNEHFSVDHARRNANGLCIFLASTDRETFAVELNKLHTFT